MLFWVLSLSSPGERKSNFNTHRNFFKQWVSSGKPFTIRSSKKVQVYIMQTTLSLMPPSSINPSIALLVIGKLISTKSKKKARRWRLLTTKTRKKTKRSPNRTKKLKKLSNNPNKTNHPNINLTLKPQLRPTTMTKTIYHLDKSFCEPSKWRKASLKVQKRTKKRTTLKSLVNRLITKSTKNWFNPLIGLP